MSLDVELRRIALTLMATGYRVIADPAPGARWDLQAAKTEELLTETPLVDCSACGLLTNDPAYEEMHDADPAMRGGRCSGRERLRRKF